VHLVRFTIEINYLILEPYLTGISNGDFLCKIVNWSFVLNSYMKINPQEVLMPTGHSNNNYRYHEK